MPDKLSIVWFSRIEDYQALSCSIKSCQLILGNHADYFVYVDDEEPVFLDIPNVKFQTSDFDQNKHTGGIERIKSELKTFKNIYNKTKNRFLLKIDSDTLCLNDRFLNWLQFRCDLFGHKASYNKHCYPYGGAYVIDCSKFDFEAANHLEEIDESKNKVMSSKKWSEDFTMSHLSSSLFLTNDSFVKKWMSFFNYKEETESIFYAVENKVPLNKMHGNSSFLNCGYGFSNTEIRDGLLQLLLITLYFQFEN